MLKRQTVATRLANQIVLSILLGCFLQCVCLSMQRANFRAICSRADLFNEGL